MNETQGHSGISDHQQSSHPVSLPPNMHPDTIFRRSPHHSAYFNLPSVVSVRVYLSDAASPSTTPTEILSLSQEIRSFWQKAQVELQNTFKHNTTCRSCKHFGPLAQAASHPMLKYLQERINDIAQDMKLWGESVGEIGWKNWKDCAREMGVLDKFMWRWSEVEHMFLEVNLQSACNGLFGEMNPAPQRPDYSFQ